MKPSDIELVDVKVSDYLVEGFENTLINKNRIYRNIHRAGKHVRLVLTSDALQPGSDPLRMHSYNIGTLSAIWDAVEVVVIHDGQSTICKEQPIL